MNTTHSSFVLRRHSPDLTLGPRESHGLVLTLVVIHKAHLWMKLDASLCQDLGHPPQRPLKRRCVSIPQENACYRCTVPAVERRQQTAQVDVLLVGCMGCIQADLSSGAGQGLLGF